MGRQLNQIIEGLSGVTAGTSTINVNLDAIEALLTTLQADVADGIIVSSGTANTNLRDGAGNAIESTSIGGKRRLDVNLSSAGTTGSSTPSTANLYAGTDGTNLRAVSVDASGRLNTNTLDGSGNAITSTVSGSSRRLDVMLSSGGATGSAAPTNANLVGGTDGTNLRGLSVDSSGRLNTNINGTVPVSGAVTANNQSVYSSGALTLSGTSALNTDLIPSTDVTAYQEVLVQVSGTFPTGATIQHQVSNDNVNFNSIVASNPNSSSGTLSATITNTGSYKVLLAGFAYYRLRVTVAGSAGTYSYAYTLNPRSSVFNTSVSVSSAPTTTVQVNPTGGFGISALHTAISAASTNATNIRTSQTNIGSLHLVNTSASLRYFKLFNLASAPTVGTSTPVLNYAIQPNSSVSIDCGWAGIRLSTGLSYAITAGQALLDNTAVGAGDVVVNIAYA